VGTGRVYLITSATVVAFLHNQKIEPAIIEQRRP